MHIASVLSGGIVFWEAKDMKTLALVVSLLGFLSAPFAVQASPFFKNPEKVGLELKSAGKIAFGPEGMLLLSDPRAASD